MDRGYVHSAMRYIFSLAFAGNVSVDWTPHGWWIILGACFSVTPFYLFRNLNAVVVVDIVGFYFMLFHLWSVYRWCTLFNRYCHPIRLHWHADYQMIFLILLSFSSNKREETNSGIVLGFRILLSQYFHQMQSSSISVIDAQ